MSQEACRVLDHYCSQLSDLERVVQPVVLKTQALIQTRENIKQARAQAEEVLDHLDASRKVIVLDSQHYLYQTLRAIKVTSRSAGRVQDTTRSSCRPTELHDSIQ